MGDNSVAVLAFGQKNSITLPYVKTTQNILGNDNADRAAEWTEFERVGHT